MSKKQSDKIVDRIDIQCEIEPVAFDDMANKAPADSSAAIRERVIKARAIQTARFKGEKGDDKGDKITDSLLWEWFTTEVGLNLINKLEDAKSVRLRYNGEDRKKEIGLTPAQVKAMVNTVKLYKAMGGQ